MEDLVQSKGMKNNVHVTPALSNIMVKMVVGLPLAVALLECKKFKPLKQ